MAKMNLREYHDEIENIINRGRFDEAIAHCRNILTVYPKSVNTYRLLGKAFLEAKRYTDAIDIFQRVLSAVPDDFVSHLGLSIIREDEGNLDAAIWHMEKAFENQPYNSAIQEELRRLFERRDGSAPPRMRLTRAALARMYVKGNLYQQATAEIRSILSKEPQRIDLQNLLAKMYLKSGKKVEAADVSSKVLNRLPYCYDANQVLANVLSESDRKDEAGIYRERLASLDPYSAYTSLDQPLTDLVVNSAVVIDVLDYLSTDVVPVEQQPDWMTTLGLSASELDSDLEEDLPDWLIAASAQIQTEEPGVGFSEDIEKLDADDSYPNLILSEDTDDIDMVEWLGSSNQKSNIIEETTDYDVQETPSEWYQEQEAALDTLNDQIPAIEADGTPEAAEIPDWLRSLAPDNLASEDQEADSELAALFDRAEPITDDTDVAGEEKDGILRAAGVVAGLTAAAGFISNEDADSSSEEAEEPDLMTEGAIEGVDQAVPLAQDLSPDPLAQSEIDELLPDWINEYQEEPDASSSVSPVGLAAAAAITSDQIDLPDWLKEIDESEEDFNVEETGTPEDFIVAEADIPEWLTEIDDGMEQTVISGSDTTDELPDWLKDLKEELLMPESSIETDLSSSEADTEEKLPASDETSEWLDGIDKPSTATDAEGKLETIEQADLSDEEPPSTSFTPDNQIELEEPPDFADADEAMAWLASLAGEQVVTNTSADVQEPDTSVEEAILNPIEELADTTEVGELELDSPPDFEDADSAMAWLEDLAAKHPASDTLEMGEPSEAAEAMDSSSELDSEAAATVVEDVDSGYKDTDFTKTPLSSDIRKVDINTASLVEIERLPGVGFPYAQAIVAYRETNGPFTNIDELVNVPGIDPDDLFSMQNYFKIEEISAKPAAQVTSENKKMLNQARQLMSGGDQEQAIIVYTDLIKEQSSLEDVIFDLNQALQNQPENYEIWQTLGDAYMRNNQMIEAMQAYNRAEELLS